MAAFEQLLGKFASFIGGGEAPTNAMAGAGKVAEALDPKVEWRGSMLPIVNYDDGTGGFGWPQMAVDTKNAFARFHRGEAPQPEDAVLAGLTMMGGIGGLGRAVRPNSVRSPAHVEAPHGLPSIGAETGRMTAPMDFDARLGLLREQLPTIRPGDDFIAQTPFEYMSHVDLPQGFAGWMDSFKPNPPRSPATVDLRDLRTFQRGIDGPRASEIAERGALDDLGNPDTSRPAVWQLPDGRYVVQDGNHRLAAAVLRGDAKAEVDVLGGLPSHSVEAGSYVPSVRPSSADRASVLDLRSETASSSVRPYPVGEESGSIQNVLSSTATQRPVEGLNTVRSFMNESPSPVQIEEVWGPKFQTLMSREYKIAEAGGDLSTQYDILSAMYNNATSLHPEQRAAIGAKLKELQADLGPEWMAKYAPDATLFSNPKEAAPAGLLATGDEESHHSRKQARNPTGQFVTADSFDGKLHAFNKVLVDLDGDGKPDVEVPVASPTNAMAAMRGR